MINFINYQHEQRLRSLLQKNSPVDYDYQLHQTFELIMFETFINGFIDIWYCWESYRNGGDIWEDINIGYTQMQDEYLMSQPGFDPYNLSGRDCFYTYILSQNK